MSRIRVEVENASVSMRRRKRIRKKMTSRRMMKARTSELTARKRRKRIRTIRRKKKTPSRKRMRRRPEDRRALVAVLRRKRKSPASPGTLRVSAAGLEARKSEACGPTGTKGIPSDSGRICILSWIKFWCGEMLATKQYTYTAYGHTLVLESI